MDNCKQQEFKQEIGDTRRLVIMREHGALLAWGISTAGIALVIYALQYATHSDVWWLWFALPFIAAPIHRRSDIESAKRCEGLEDTSLYHLLSQVSKVTVMLIVTTIIASSVFNFSGYFIILLILSLWCGLSGFMLDYHRLLQLATGGCAISFALLMSFAAGYELPLFAVGVCIVLVMPGLDMLKREKGANY